MKEQKRLQVISELDAGRVTGREGAVKNLVPAQRETLRCAFGVRLRRELSRTFRVTSDGVLPRK